MLRLSALQQVEGLSLPSVRGDFLFRLGRYDEARRAFEQAAALAGNKREQGLLRRRAAEAIAAGAARSDVPA